MLPQMRAWGKATGHKLPPTCPSTRSDNGISLLYICYLVYLKY